MKVSTAFALWYKYGAYILAFVNLAGQQINRLQEESNMFATSSHPIRAAVTAAAMSVTAFFAPWNASAQELVDAKRPHPLLQQPADSDFTKQQCMDILDRAVRVFYLVGHKGYNPELPRSIAGYFAPGDEGITNLVHAFLTLKSDYEQFATSTYPRDLPMQQRFVAGLTCNGPKLIVADGQGITLWNTIRVTVLRELGLSLDRAGLRGVLPEMVGSLSAPNAPKLLTDVAPRQKLKLH